ncbi:MAG: choice-of-anchor D domain-containing protein [Planctomycetota bacterium]|nr:choice-of-anchor D domain-containing protein [Planctomycetota bacterium]
MKYGQNGDIVVAGDWTGDGRDNLGFVRSEDDGLLHWYLDTDYNFSTPEIHLTFGVPGDQPVTGNWDGIGGDGIGVVRETGDGLRTWMLDTNYDGNTDLVYKYGLVGDVSVVGDWNDDGKDDFASIRQFEGYPLYWLFDLNRDTDADWVINFGNPGDVPIAGDFRFPNSSVSLHREWDGQTIQIDPNHQDEIFLGYIEDRQPILTFDLEVLNSGDATLHLPPPDEIDFLPEPQSQGTESNFEAVSTTEFIAPGKTGKITLRIDATDAVNIESFKAHVRFATSDPDAPTYRFHAIVTQLFTNDGGGITDPESLPDIALSVDGQGIGNGAMVDFGNTLRNTPVTKRITIRNGGDGTLEITRLGYTGSNAFKVPTSNSRGSLNPGESMSIDVSFTSNLAGTYHGEISLASNDPGENPLVVELLGKVATELAPDIDLPEFGVEQLSLDFGRATVGQTARKSITIKNVGTATLQIKGVDVATTSFKLVGAVPKVVNAGQQATLTVEMLTKSSGTKQGKLVITSNDPDESRVTVPLTGRVDIAPKPPEVAVFVPARAGSPKQEVKPGQNGSIDFSGVVQGDSQSYFPISFRLQNQGQGTLQVGNPTSPSGYEIVGLPVTLDAGQSKDVEIRLDRRSLGSKSGTISFTTNDADESTIRIDVRGKVYEAIQWTSGSSPIFLPSGTLTIYSVAGDRIEIAPPHGAIPRGTSAVVYNYAPRNSNGGWSRIAYSNLKRVIVRGPSGVVIEKWTDVAVTHTRSTSSDPLSAENQPAGNLQAASSLDVNQDGAVSPIDALLVINELNARASGTPMADASDNHNMDVNGDSVVSPLDALLVINDLNSRTTAEGELSDGYLPAKNEMALPTINMIALATPQDLASVSPQNLKGLEIVDYTELALGLTICDPCRTTGLAENTADPIKGIAENETQLLNATTPTRPAPICEVFPLCEALLVDSFDELICTIADDIALARDEMISKS